MQINKEFAPILSERMFSYEKSKIGAKIFVFGLVLTFAASFSLPALAADGSGTNIVSPNTAIVGSSGNTHTFTFTAAETMDSGEISISTPSGWSAMQGTSGTVGYTTAASTGVIANIEDNADSISGWSAGNACSNGLTLDTTTKHEGSGSVLCSTANQSSGNKFYKNISSQDWSSYTKIGFWIMSGKNFNANDLRFDYDNNSNISSPIATLNLPALTANVWAYVTLTLSGTRTSILSYGLEIRNKTRLDNTTINVDDILLGPGNPTFSGGVMHARILTLSSGQTITTTYGSGGGTSGATAPSTGGVSTFTTQSRVSDSGTLTSIVVSPTITVNNPVPTTTSLSPTSTTAGGTNFTLTVNGTNFVNGSTVRWNGLSRTTTYVSANQLTATILSSDIATAGTSTITVFNSTPGGGTSNSQTFTVNNPVPTTTSLSPTSTTAGGTNFTLTVNGTNFISSSVVNWNGSARTTTYVSPTQLTATILSSDIATAGTSTITVFNSTPGGGTSNSRTFTVNNPVPTTTSLSPTSTSAGGSNFTLTVNGTNFISSSQVKWNGSSRTTTYVSPTQLTATILSSDITTAGTASVTVFNPTPGGGTSNAQTLTVNNLTPSITNISPSVKNAGDSGFTLTVNGTNFVSNSVVQWNGGSRTTTFVSSTQLTASILSSDIATSGTSTVTVFNPAPGGGTSSGTNFTVAAVATQFVILSPGNGTVDAPVSVTIQAQKSDGSVDTNYQNDVTLVASGSATGGGLVDIVNGVGMASISDNTSQTVTLSLSDTQSTGLAVTSTQSIIFSAGAITEFALNNPGNMNANTRLGYLVTRKDQYGNSVINATTTVYLYTSSASANHGFYDDSLAGNLITSIPIPNGSANAQFWYYETQPGNYTITISDNPTAPDGTTGIDDATSSITVYPVATKFVISAPATTTVDSPVTVTIQAQKPDNSIDTNYQNDVTLVANGSATGGGLIDIINGVGTKQISDTVPETVHLSLSDTQSTGLNVSSNQNVVFGVGSVAQFTLSHPGSIGAGQRAAYTVTRKDQYGNLATTGTTTAYLYSSSSGANKKFYDAATGGNIIASIQIPDGQSTANFWYYDDTLGTWTVTASDNAIAPDGASGIQDAMDSINVITGSTAGYFLNNPGNMTAGTRLGYTVTRKDQFGNLVTSGNATTYLYSTDLSGISFYLASTGGSPVNSVLIPDGNSSANFWYYDNTPGTYTITASDNSSAPDGSTGIADGTDSVTINAAPIVATRFVILPTATGTVDNPVTVTIQAQDNSGNLDTTATSSVTLITSGSATGGGLVTMVNGVGTINISDHMAETVNLSLSDTQGTGLNVSSVQTAVFNPGAVAQFSLDNPGDVAAGTRLGFTVTRKDQFGNLVTSGATTAYLYSSSLGTYHFYDSSSGGSAITSIDIINGTSSVGFWYYDEKSESTTVIVSDSSSAPDGATGISDASRNITVSPGPIYKFVLDNPGNMTAGTRLGYTVTRKDQFDNLVTSGVVTAYLYSSSSGTTTKFYDSASGGLAETLVVFNNNQSSVQFWYFDETPGTWVVTVSDGNPSPNGATGILDSADTVVVSTVPITPTRIIIVPLNSTYPVGVRFPVTVKVQDDNGNTDTLYNSSATLVATGNVVGAGLVVITNGVGVISISDPKVESATLSLQDTASTGLDVSSQQIISFVTSLGPAFTPGQPINYSPVVITGVQISGKAFALAKINMVGTGIYGQSIVDQKSSASLNGSFTVNLNGLPPGATSYAIVGTDGLNRISQTKIFGANLTDPNQLLEIKNILLSPTLGLIRTTITRGDFVGLIGTAVPGYKIEAQIDGKTVLGDTVADSKGNYKILVNTANLDFGSHTARARQISPASDISEYAPQQVFSVTSVFTPNMDFNNDGVIDIKDWSIFITRWSSTDPKVKALDDLNGDGKVDVQDFSIFVRTLKQQ